MNKNLNSFFINENTWKQFDNKRVLLRADLNVPLYNGIIYDDFRLISLLPTLEYLKAHNSTVIIVTHRGRPQGTYNPELSTKQLIPWFEKKGYPLFFASTLEEAKKMSAVPGRIILLENIRFWPQEQRHDKEFAHQLAQLADFYINDAFATLHRNDTSISLVPLLFDPHKRFLGPLVEKELSALDSLLNNSHSPFLLILGGAKAETKIAMINNLLNTIDSLILNPALVFTFLKAQGKAVGKSLVASDLITTAQSLIENAASKHKTIYYPLDYQIALNTLEGPLSIVSAPNIPDNAFGISIGPASIKYFKPLIMSAKTIFFNSAMGFAQRPETQTSTSELLKLVSQSKAFSVVAGGDSVACARREGLEDKLNYLSTGGGASLAYLAGQQLPGLAPFSSAGIAQKTNAC